MRKCKTLKEVENRNAQFEHIKELKNQFIENKLPVLSIDTKKKEIIGNFSRSGERFCTQAQEVLDHDFKSFSEGTAVPQGIYDVAQNTCFLSIGTNHDTAEFVMDNIDYHWNNSIKQHYPNAKKMLILCDGGGSNSSSHYVVKERFKQLAVKLQIEIVVAHYPSYTSRLCSAFSQPVAVHVRVLRLKTGLRPRQSSTSVSSCGQTVRHTHQRAFPVFPSTLP
jgi:hypothetical protein